MFAVPGWSIQASALKTQVVANEKVGNQDKQNKRKNDTVNAVTPQTSETVAAQLSNNKKRKRKEEKLQRGLQVDESNLASLWESVIEKKGSNGSSDVSAIGAQVKTTGAEDGAVTVTVVPEDVSADTEPRRKKLKERKRELKKRKLEEQNTSNTDGLKAVSHSKSTLTKAQAPKQPQTQPPKPTTITTTPTFAKLTPLQTAMRQKLISARFRHLNEELYTKDSRHSLNLFSTNPEMFQEYHEGFRRQVEVWPENPVDGFVAQIQARGRQRGFLRGKDVYSNEDGSKAVMPLPRTNGVCYIADLGCGDAALSANLEKDKKKCKLEVFSYDLQSPSALVTKADIANLPLEDDSIDVAIFCLALMGTNWVDFIEEAYRVLRWKGELWIAEIKSRFGRVGGANKGGSGGRTVVEHSVGHRKKQPQTTNGKKAALAATEQDDKALLVEVDGHDAPQATDVSAFVEVLRKRGFVLQSDTSTGAGPGTTTSTAVDLSNRMFVRMHFIKGLAPIKGKCVPLPEGAGKLGLETWKRKAPKGRFIDESTEGEEVHVSSEAAVLKPCVYKIR